MMVMAFIGGIVLGILFFGGLWLTVKKAVVAKNIAVWFLASSLLRITIVLVGFYYIADGYWQRLLICVLGFVVGRYLIMRFTKSRDEDQIELKKVNQL